MEAKELMIGDWCAYGINCKGRVTALTEHLITLSVDGDEINGLYMLMPDMARPIPLTEEILVKNGFVYREAEETCATNAYHHWQLDGHWFALDYTQYFRKEKKDDMPRFDVAGVPIHYVHQLQHLLRLCNIDKEISI